MVNKTIIFDMDGTLVNTGSVIANTINYVRENLGLEKLEKNYLLENVNNPHINPSEFFYGTDYFTDTQSKLFEEYYYENCVTDIELYDGIQDLLSELNTTFNLTIATNAFDTFAYKILKHLEIDGFFQSVIGANNVTKAKPNPEMVLKVMDKFGGSEKKENFVFIGDSHKDKMAAEGAQIEYLMVDWGFTEHSNAVADTKVLKKEIYRILS